MARIILAAGGTGGHIFPALAVGEILEKAGHEVILFTDKRGAPMVEGAVSYRVISGASPFHAGIMRKLAGLSQLAIGVVQSLGAMASSRPDSVIGFGGYPSFAPLFAARALRVPIILHEQNAVMGRANRLLAKLASHIALSFDKTSGAPKDKRVTVTGLPVRDAFFDSAPYQANKTCHITVIGGSLGAQIFADVIPQAIARLPQDIAENLTLTQQARDEHIASLKQAYKELGVRADVARFYHDVASLFANSDIIISRAGASSVGEITACGRPAILVPFAAAMDDHQTGNAMRLVDKGAAIMMAEADIDAETLAKTLATLIQETKKREMMAGAARALGDKDAALNIARLTGLSLEDADEAPANEIGAVL